MKSAKKVYSGTVLIVGLILFAFLVPCQAGTNAEQRDASQSMELEQITVTAQKTETSVQDVPASVSVFDGLALEDMQVDSLDDVSVITPNIGIDRPDNHTTYLVYRGMGGMINMNKIFNVNIDGVTIPYVALANFLDLERVEVLRGSQGCLYGRNSYSGIINIITRRPSNLFEGYVRAEYGSYDSGKFQSGIGGPISDRVSYRLAFAYKQGDGYFKNDFLGIDDGNEQEQISGQGKLVFDIAQDSRLTLELLLDKFDDGFDAYSLTGDYHTTNNESGYNDGHLMSPILTWEKEIGSMKLTSITNYSHSNYGMLQDWDFARYDAVTGEYDETYKTLTQELRLNGKTDSGLQWLGGLFLMTEDHDMETIVRMGQDAGPSAGMVMGQNSTLTSRNAALFGQFTWPVSAKVEISGGLRLDYSRKELDWRNFSNMPMPVVHKDFTDDWFALLPSFSISWLPAKEHRAYLSVVRGYKEGDYNCVEPNPATVSKAVGPEYTITYEAGYKGLFADRRVELNLAAFYIKWKDMQVDVVDLDNVQQLKKENAAEAHSSGLELEARMRLTRGLTAFFNAGYMLDYEFDEFITAKSGQIIDLKGNLLPKTNEYTVNTGFIYRHSSGIFAAADVSFMGPKYFTHLNEMKQDAYTLLNAKVGYEAQNWSVSVFGRNLLDEKHIISTFGRAKMTAEPLVVGIQASSYF